MKIWTIEHEEPYYDSFCGHVVVANSEDEVKQLAKKKAADEGEDIWNDAEIKECGKYTGNKTKPFILMSDFWAG